MTHLNLVLEVTALPNHRYRINMTAPVGSVSVEAEAPFSAEERADFQAILQRQREGVTRAQEAQAARVFGGRLFDFLIRRHQDLNAAYFASLERAGDRGLRLRLVLDRAGDLADLPWEFLRDPARDFLALSRQTPVVRYSPLLSVRPGAPVKPPLRALVLVASPHDYAALDAEGEWRRVQEATTDLQARGMLVVERMDEATLIGLQRRLRAREYHIFHYIGHSVYDDIAGQGLLVFEDETDTQRSQLISAASLSRELSEESAIRLVILNSCQSAAGTSSDDFSGIASSLVARGIPAVVAMQQRITDGAAKAFAEEFYRAIAERLPIDSAVSEGRRAIANRVNSIEWGTPVLYLRADDGRLFGAAADTTRVTQPVRAPSTPDTQPRATRPRVRRFPWALTAFVIALLGLIIVAAIAILRQPPAPEVTPSPTVPVVLELPDLEVTNFRIFPQQPRPGEVFRLSVGILNSGRAPSGPFAYAWDASPRLQFADTGEIPNLPAGASRNFVITYVYGWWGTYDSQIIIDDVGAVDEEDERNNRRSFPIEVNPTAEFNVDFRLLPTLDFAEPEMPLESDTFVPWNMIFGIDGASTPACLATPILFRELDGGDMAIRADATGVSAECPFQPLVVELAQPAGNARAVIVPEAAGSAEIVLFSDRAGTREVARFVAALTPDEPIALGSEVAAGTRVRRIQIRADGQPVTLTTLTLLPPT